MTKRSVHEIADMLRTGAPGARREAPPSLHRDIVRSVADAPVERERAPREPRTGGERWRQWRSRGQETLAAAAILLAIGVWGFAFLRDQPDGRDFKPSAVDTADVEDGAPQNAALSALENAASREAISQVAGSAPAAVHSAIDGALLTEVDNIAHDADRAAHFLLGRLPLVLATHGDEASR